METERCFGWSVYCTVWDCAIQLTAYSNRKYKCDLFAVRTYTVNCLSVSTVSLLVGDGRWRQVIRRCASVSDTGVTGVCNWGVQVSSWKKNDGCNFFPYQIYIFITASCIAGERCVLGGVLLQPRLMQLSHEGAGSLPHSPHHGAAPQAPFLAVREQAAFLIPLITTLLLRLLL